MFIEIFEKIGKETMHRPNDETTHLSKKDAKKCYCGSTN
jgi:hypothetical protein